MRRNVDLHKSRLLSETILSSSIVQQQNTKMYAQLVTGALALTATNILPTSTGLSPRQATKACPSDPSTITCPNDNGCLATASNGAIFKMQCTTNLNGRVIEVAQVKA